MSRASSSAAASAPQSQLQTNSSSQDSATTQVIHQLPPKSGLDWQPIISGAITSLIAFLGAYLIARYSNREANAKAAADREAARTEAIRQESNSRRIDAMEKLATAIAGIEDELAAFVDRCTTPNAPINHIPQPSVLTAKAMVVLYFNNRIRNVWDEYETAYHSVRHDALLYSIEIGKSPQDNNAIANAKVLLLETQGIMLSKQTDLHESMQALMPELVP